VLFLNVLLYETMVRFDARLNSFNRRIISLQLDINAVCEAGFFYSGKMIKILIIFHRSF